jgi:hypothetical protein
MIKSNARSRGGRHTRHTTIEWPGAGWIAGGEAHRRRNWKARISPPHVAAWSQSQGPFAPASTMTCLACTTTGGAVPCTGPEMILAVVQHVVGDIDVGLDDTHNNSVPRSFYEAYYAGKERHRQDRRTPLIT